MNSNDKNTNLENYATAGTETDQINVRISHRIIQLFSEGLYSSPNKAIEELVSNSFDAGAQNVHIILSPDLRDPDATIVVIDDGEGMNADGLKRHWIIGESTRRRELGSQRRKPIGKFGIGKLSTYVLATKLTHISKYGDKYFGATMDYSNLTGSVEHATNGVFDEQTIHIPLRSLSREEAYSALQRWVTGSKEGFSALKLFGRGSSHSWTVAIMSDLKQMGKEVKIGRLKWVLRTAMPLRSDFKLYLDGDPITSPSSDKPLERFVIGKDIIQMPKPCPDGMSAREDTTELIDSIHRFGVYHDELLGRITGFIEVFKDDLDIGKQKFEQSSGFFVYVRGRRVNVDDPGFGIERNLLRHGTFSRFRMVVYIDSLDDALRSSRESFQQGVLYETVQNFLRAGFNLARNRLVEHDRSQTPAALISSRISAAPGSMTRKPILSLAHLVAENKATPFYMRFPIGLSSVDQASFLQTLKERSEGTDGLLSGTEIVALDSKEGVAVLDVQEGKLLINSSHPFVAAFQEFFADSNKSLSLEIFFMTEILMEAHLYHLGLDERVIRDILATRDELLRQFVKSSVRRTAGMIAIALQESRDDENRLEEEMRAAFEAMGFANVIRIGGKGKPDGTAEAHLAATEDGTVQRYKVGLEAKSGQRVSAKRLDVSGIARHMKDFHCDHHLVIGNGFATSTGEDSASVKEIKNFEESTMKVEGKRRTITLMHIDDLARLIRIASSKRVGGLSRLRNLFTTCVTPEESKAWVDALEIESPESWPYRAILDTIWERAEKRPDTAIEYSAVMTALEYRDPPIKLSKKELIECCKSMQVMARGVVFARDNTVEIDRRPDLIIEDIKSAVGDLPDEEKRKLHL